MYSSTPPFLILMLTLLWSCAKSYWILKQKEKKISNTNPVFIKLVIFYHELIFTTFYFFKYCIKHVIHFIAEFLAPPHLWACSSGMDVWVNCGFQGSGPAPSRENTAEYTQEISFYPSF